MAQIILASASPRRSELLRQAGMDFVVIPSRGEEVVTSTHPAEVVEELSLQKAPAGKCASGIYGRHADREG